MTRVVAPALAAAFALSVVSAPALACGWSTKTATKTTPVQTVMTPAPTTPKTGG